MLEVKDIDVHYGRSQAIFDVSLSVDKGSVVALVGANGAGKTTLVNAVSGIVRPSSGSIHFEGQRIDGLAPEAIVRMGIIQVAEGRQLFPGLTIEENLMIGAYTARDRKAVRSALEHVYDLFPILLERRTYAAQTLSGGQQQMLAIGRALMAKPRLLICDEPSLGLAPLIVKGIFDVLIKLNRSGIPILLIEQNVKLSFDVSQHALVLEQGKVVLQGPSEELRNNPHVTAAYLGM